VVLHGAAAHIGARLANLRQKMAHAHIPALFVTNPQDVSYLTGFEGDDSFLIVTEDRAVLISDSRYEEQIAREAPWLKTRIRTKGILLETAKVLKSLKIRKLGVQEESLTLRQLADLKDNLKGGKTYKLVPVHEIVMGLRHIKDEVEIQITEEAIRIAEQALLAIRSQLRPGLSENEIASLLVHEMRKRGATGPSFDTIVALGANGSLPHYRPGEVARGERGEGGAGAKGEALLIDWGARYRGYCSDLTRVWFIGSIPPPLGEIYRVVLDAQIAAIAAIKPGRTGRQIDQIARGIIAKAGYGKQFGHGLGHGVGRDIHEPISLSRLSKTRLVPGMIVTVEPGIYLPGIGGVRIEDDVLVTPTGCRVLSSLPKDLEWARQ